MSDGRQRLKPWLESKIESGTIPGLCWLDRDQKTFRIPWKRNGTTEWVREGSALFRDYAIHTGKFQEGIDKEDYPVWKTRLRCALNKHPEIISHKQYNKEDGNDPYRVYQMKENSTRDELLPTQENEVEMVEDLRPQMSNIDSAVVNQKHFNIPNAKELFPNTDLFSYGSMDSDLKKISNSELISLSPAEYSKLENEQLQMPEHNFELIFRVQSKELERHPVKNCCFLTKNCAEEMRNEFPVISFPDIMPETEEVRKITSVLWQNLTDGIYIGFDESCNILAQRLCKCRIYYRNQNNQHGLKLERSDGKSWTVIFNYLEFCQNIDNRDLQADVTLYIGQKDELNPYNVFLSVTINHLHAMKHLNNRNMKMHDVSMSM